MNRVSASRVLEALTDPRARGGVNKLLGGGTDLGNIFSPMKNKTKTNEVSMVYRTGNGMAVGINHAIHIQAFL